MRYLLDTNIFIYAVLERDVLDKDVDALLADYDNQFYLSSESTKELIVLFKHKNLGHKRWCDAKQMVEDIENRYNITILPIKKEHLLTYAGLETPEFHNDPSDHVIIAQAITEKMPLISSDSKFPFYIQQGLDLVLNKK